MLRPIYCENCKIPGSNRGRYLGSEQLVEGQIRLKCPVCKNWTHLTSRVVDRERVDPDVKKF